MTNTDVANAPLSNDNTAEKIKELMKEVRELGRDAAMGKDAMPKLAHRVVRAAHDGYLSMKKDAEGKDDAAKVFTEYSEAEGKKALHERTGNGLKANISKLRQLIAFGCEQVKYDPVDVMNKAFAARTELLAGDTKVVPAYHGYVSIARDQLSKTTQLTDDQIKNHMIKQASDDPTLVDQLQKALTILEGLVTGENKYGLKDQSEEVILAQEAIARRLTFCVKEAEYSALMARLGELQAA